MSDFNTIVQTVAVYLVPVLFAISLHEAAHGYAARYFGDPTASNEGRLSLNPIRHIDPFGTILLPLMLYFTIQVPFGYAKPVPVDFSRLRNPKKQMAWVAFAGPGANFVMGLGWMIAFVVLSVLPPTEMGMFFRKMAGAGVSVNAAMFVFNLIPVPPLDGGRIMTGLLPMQLAPLRQHRALQPVCLRRPGAADVHGRLEPRLAGGDRICHRHLCHPGHAPDGPVDLIQATGWPHIIDGSTDASN